VNDRMIFVRHEPPEASPGLLIFIGLLLILAATSCGVVVGFEWRDYLQRQADEAAKFKPRPTVAKPVQLIPCTYEGRLEHDRICRARLRSMGVGK
jgi:hypothetical protein